MTEDKHANQLKLTVPEAQRQQLQQAIISLVAVLLGILLTLAGQLTSQLLITEPPPVETVADPLTAFGTTHFTDVSVTEDLAVTDDASVGGDLTVTGDASVGTLTLDSTTFTQTQAVTITGILTDVMLIYVQN
jgi:hypothetical protein